MSEQQTRIEYTGNIQVHHPAKTEEPSTHAVVEFESREDWYASWPEAKAHRALHDA
jgi:hypothetical protein